MQRLITEFKERRIWRTLVAYPSVSFVLLQAIEFFINNYGWDKRLLTAGIVLAAGLLPGALLWNWRHGEVGRQSVNRVEIATYGVVIIATILAVGAYWRTTPLDEPPLVAGTTNVHSIAVLPFDNLSGNDDVQYLCEGIAESLINWLASVPNVRVIAKSATFRLSPADSDETALRTSLGVDSVVRGRLESVGDQIVVSASLTDTRDQTQLWGERLASPLADVMYLERSIVNAIRNSLRLKIGDTGNAHAASGGTDNPEAYRHYVRGHYLIQATDLVSIENGLAELRAAITFDPTYGRPYADIADALSQMIFYGVYNDPALIGEARTAAYSAVALAPELPESQTAMATMHQYLTFDWQAADQAYEAAIAMAPQSPAPYHRYADFLWITLRVDRALEMAERAYEIDPLDSSTMHARGISALFAGDFDEAADAFLEWNRFHPGSLWSYAKSAVALALDGQCGAATSQLDRLEHLTGDTMSTLMESWVAWAYKVCGDIEQFTQAKEHILAASADDPSAHYGGLAYLFALDGDSERLIDLIRTVVDEKSPVTLFVQVFLLDYMGWSVADSLRQSDRYRQLIQQLNFPPTPWSLN